MTAATIFPAIPTPLTPLIGRADELAQITELLTSDVRLLTITGIGGIGKTRLATQIALELEPHFTTGAMIVPLAAIREETAIPIEIAKALGHPTPGSDIPGIVEMLGTGDRLLVLDNLEQIPKAGDTISAIIAAHPGLTVLCTSQVSLDVPGEYVYPLQPMPVAAVDSTVTSLRTSSAVALFVYRARTANASRTFTDDEIRLIAEICSMLDGLPLAIELAAARTAILTLPELRERLSDRLEVLTGGSRQMSDRLRTMRNAIGWSYGLLHPDERRIFRYLGVYGGNLHIEAIEHTLATLAIERSPLDTIEFFVSRSLLRQVPGGGYQMLESLKAFAQEQRVTEGDAYEARLTQATYIVNLAEAAEPHMQGNNQAEWFARLAGDVTNILAVSEWAASKLPELTIRILANTWRFLEMQGLAKEFTRLGNISISAVTDSSLLAPAHVGLGYLHEGNRELEQAESHFSSAIKSSRACNNHRAETQALNGLGLIAMNRSQMDTARDYLQQSLELATTHNYPRGQIGALGNLAAVSMHTGNFDDAEDKYRQVVDMLENSDDKVALSASLSNLSLVTSSNGNPRLGREYALRALKIDREINSISNLVYSLGTAAGASHWLGHFTEARQLYEESVQLARSTNMKWLELETTVHLANTLHELGEDALALQYILPILTQSTTLAMARTIIGTASIVATIAHAHDDNEAAMALIGGTLRVRDEYDAPAIPNIATRERALRDSIPADNDHPNRIAYESAQSWDLDQLRRETLNVVQQLQARLVVTPAQQPDRAAPAPKLSPRELEVLAMAAKGHSNAEIAKTMFISMRTTTTHLTNIFTKLHVKNRMAAVTAAREANLLPED